MPQLGKCRAARSLQPRSNICGGQPTLQRRSSEFLDRTGPLIAQAPAIAALLRELVAGARATTRACSVHFGAHRATPHARAGRGGRTISVNRNHSHRGLRCIFENVLVTDTSRVPVRTNPAQKKRDDFRRPSWLWFGPGGGESYFLWARRVAAKATIAMRNSASEPGSGTEAGSLMIAMSKSRVVPTAVTGKNPAINVPVPCAVVPPVPD